jgi:hypothetical protein
VTPQRTSTSNIARVTAQALLTTFAIFSGLFAAAAVNAAPRDPNRIAVVFHPWWSQAQIVAAAGAAGDIAAAGGAPFVMVLRDHDGRQGGERLSDRARSAGALFVLDPDLAGVCAPRDRSPQEPAP